jgi:hypothetical protein
LEQQREIATLTCPEGLHTVIPAFPQKAMLRAHAHKALCSGTHRDDRAAEKDAMLAAAALKLQLSQLLLEDMITMRKNGVFNWKKHYEQAVVLCGQVGYCLPPVQHAQPILLCVQKAKVPKGLEVVFSVNHLLVQTRTTIPPC